MTKLVMLVLSFFVTHSTAKADIQELQYRISEHLSKPEVSSRINLLNTIFDKVCTEQVDREPKNYKLTLNDGSVLRNYEEVFSGISRFEFPTYEALIQSHSQGLCDETITLNAECQISVFDKDGSGSLSPQEEGLARERLKVSNVEERIINELLDFYKRNGKICNSSKLNPELTLWHRVIWAREPELSVKEIFQALELILAARANKKSVCFHCAEGKHRTGLVSMLLEFSSLEESNESTTREIYDRYYRHAWFGECMTRIETIEVLPLILESPEFKNFGARWKAAN